MGGILLGNFELPVSNNQEEDQLPLYDSTEGKEWQMGSWSRHWQTPLAGVEVQIGSEVDPLLELARVKEEREKVFGKKSNFLRRRGLDPYAGMWTYIHSLQLNSYIQMNLTNICSFSFGKFWYIS